MSQLPPMENRRSPTPKIYHPQPRSGQDLENPYAEITDSLPGRVQSTNHDEASQPTQAPVVEQIAFTRVENVESVKMPQLHDNPTYAMTKESDQHLTPNAPQRTQDLANMNNGMQGSPSSSNQSTAQYAYPSASQQPSDIWQPQPLRAKKEQILFIYKEDSISPRGLSVVPLAEDNTLNQADQVDSTRRQSDSRTSGEVGDDAMTWLQKQQQKLKEKREREGRIVNPTFQPPRRELPKVPEPRRELPLVPEPVNQSPVLTANVEIPTDNLSWLEQKQRKLQRLQEEQSRPLFINTSQQGPSYATSVSPRTESSGNYLSMSSFNTHCFIFSYENWFTIALILFD